jgi:hypothetical protein
MVRAGTGIGRMPRRVAQHGDEHASLAAAQPLDVARQLVDPDRDLEAERRRHRVLAVGPAGQQRVLGALGQVGQGGEQRRELVQEDRVGPAHL